MHKKIAAALLLPAVMLLSSCDLLPAEEPVRTVTMVRSADQTEYKTATIIRGDLAQTRRLYCSYLPLRTDMLSFAVGGEYIDEIFVQVGDYVQEGQLLAQLEMEDLEKEITESQRAISALELELGYLANEEEIEIERQRILHADPDALADALADVTEGFEARRQTIEDSLLLERMHLDVLEQEKAEKQIRAPYDGTITYLRTFADGETSRLRDRVMTIVDSSMSIFRVDTEHWQYLNEGMQFTITANNAEYSATVTTTEALGHPPEEIKEGGYGRIYMKPDGIVVGLKDNDRGTFDLVLDSREDVLLAPVNAVATLNGQTVVYYVQENGVKAYKPVTTGMEANAMVEIIEGVTEGELVVVPY